jgi:hypothetical protein
MKKIYASIALVATLFACETNKQGEVKKVDSTQQNITKDSTDVGNEIVKVTAELPSPVDFVAHINQAKLEYNPKFLNSVDNATAYQTSSKAALNLGIYLVDLGYHSLYLKSQEGLNYLKAAKKLSDQLNILDEQTKFLVERFENNLENRDSLLSIAREGYFTIDGYLQKNDRKEISSYVLIGSWVEGLYIGTSLLKTLPNYDSDEKYKLVLWRIGGQKNSLNNLVTIVSKLEKNEENKQLLAKLQDLQKAYENVKVEEGNKNDIDVLDIAEVQSSDEISEKMMAKTIKKVEITKADIDSIHEKVSELRNFIVKK